MRVGGGSGSMGQESLHVLLRVSPQKPRQPCATDLWNSLPHLEVVTALKGGCHHVMDQDPPPPDYKLGQLDKAPYAEKQSYQCVRALLLFCPACLACQVAT